MVANLLLMVAEKRGEPVCLSVCLSVVGVRKLDLRFLDQLSRKNQNVVQFKSHWRKRLSVILQKCNAIECF